MAASQKRRTTMVPMIDQQRELAGAINELALILNTKASVLVALAIQKEYGTLLEQLGLYRADSVVIKRQTGK